MGLRQREHVAGYPESASLGPSIRRDLHEELHARVSIDSVVRAFQVVVVEPKLKGPGIDVVGGTEGQHSRAAVGPPTLHDESRTVASNLRTALRPHPFEAADRPNGEEVRPPTGDEGRDANVA